MDRNKIAYLRAFIKKKKRISKTEKSINDAQEKNRSPKMYKNNTDSRILNSNSI